jgi:hypothetical protein
MIQSIELVQLDELVIDSASSPLMSAEREEVGSADAIEPGAPIEISCRGPCRIDISKGELVLEDQVDVRQHNGQGLEDFLRCGLLKLLFQTVMSAAPSGSQDAAGTRTSQLGITGMVAIGKPVVIDLSSRLTSVEGSRVEYDGQTRLLRVFSQTNAVLRHVARGQAYGLEARHFEYQLGEPGSLGSFHAFGPGQFRQTSGGDRRSLEASWNRQLDFHRVGQQQHLEIDGQAKARVPESGDIRADHLRLILEDAPRLPGPGGSIEMALRPVLFLATGNVHCDSAQLRADCQRLQARFRHEAAAGSAANGDSWGPGPLSKPPGSIASFSSTPSNGARNNNRQSEPVAVAGDSIEVWMTVANRQGTTVDRIRVDMAGARRGTDELHEVATGREDQRADSRLARITARGMSIDAGNIHFDRLQNRIWSDGRGRLQMPLPASPNGPERQVAQQATITWPEARSRLQVRFTSREPILNCWPITPAPNSVVG